MFLAALTSRSWTVPHSLHCHSRTCSGLGPSLTPHAEQTWLVGSNRPIFAELPAVQLRLVLQHRHERRPAGVVHRLRQPRPREALHRKVLHRHRLVFADDLRGELVVEVPARVGDAARAPARPSRGPSPCSCCPSACGTGLAAPASASSPRGAGTAARRSSCRRPDREVAEAEVDPALGVRLRQRLAGHLDHERREEPARRVPDHRDRRRGGRQVTRPADLDVPDLRQPQPPVVQHLEPGVGGEPDRLPRSPSGTGTGAARPSAPSASRSPSRRSSGRPRSGPPGPAASTTEDTSPSHARSGVVLACGQPRRTAPRR